MKKLPLLFASIITATLFAATGGSANAANAPVYKFAPVVAMTKSDTVVVNDVLWKCGPAGCVANTANSRPAVVCAQAARKVGKIASFSVKGSDFDATALESCNAKAKS